ncbi:MAG: hypothetical protein ACI9UQ_001075 [Candidatus Krumholzibacteriia bacterium]|jgi:hypothetical protein
MKILALMMILLIPSLGSARPLWVNENGEAQIDLSVLDEWNGKSGEEISLPVGDREFVLQLEPSSTPNLGVTSYRGKIDNNPDSFFLLCRGQDGAAVAFFQPGDGTAYRLDHTLGYDSIRQVDYEKTGSCGGGVTPPNLPAIPQLEAQTPRNSQKAALAADDGTRHDVLIGYTDGAATAMGGVSFVEAEAQLSVDAANLAYVNSGIGSALRLVHVMNVDYNENAAFSYGDHLDALWIPNDGNMDAVLAMRETVGADFLSVLVNGRDLLGEVRTCGIGYVMDAGNVSQNFASAALSIISVSCAATSWSFAHEVGHNRGCAHNREDAGVAGAYGYSYGYRWTGFRSVMAYDNSAMDFVRVPNFSNPSVTYNGVPTGSNTGNADAAHNALTHANTNSVAAAFKSERTFVEFGWSGTSTGLFVAPYTSITSGLSGSREGGTLVIRNNKTSFIGTLSSARTYVHVGTGSVLLGGL